MIIKRTQLGSRAFTLIELLVVIAIIAILAAILFPVFAHARENARRTTCLSNENQIGLAIMQYTEDNDEYYPGRYGAYIGTPNTAGYTQQSWRGLIYPYIKSAAVFKCPDAPQAQVVNTVFDSGQFSSGYALWAPAGFTFGPFHFPTAGNFGSQNMAQIQDPSWALIVLESDYVYPDYGPYLAYTEPSQPGTATCESIYQGVNAMPCEAVAPSSMDSGHSKNACNILYHDGHAKYTLLADTFNVGSDGLDQWQFNRANVIAAGDGWVYTLQQGLAQYNDSSY